MTFRPPQSRLAKIAQADMNWKPQVAGVGRFFGSSRTISTSHIDTLTARAAVASHVATEGSASPASSPIAEVSADQQFKALMMNSGFVSVVSKDICPVEGSVYLDTFMRVKGVDAITFKFTLRAKVRRSACVLPGLLHYGVMNSAFLVAPLPHRYGYLTECAMVVFEVLVLL
jgi:hypothetical protein